MTATEEAFRGPPDARLPFGDPIAFSQTFDDDHGTPKKASVA